MARVLVVDDEPIVGQVIAQILRREGHEADAVLCAGDGLQRSREGRFQVALIDIRLPDIDGLDLARRIHSEFPNQRIIIMSGGPEAHDDCYCEMAKTVGISKVIPKPFTHTQLVSAVLGGHN